MNSNTIRLETLSKHNYDTWKIQAEALLIKNDSWGYVSGEIPKPILMENGSNINAVKNWENNDRKAKSDLILSINPSELKQIKGYNTSREVWLKLEEIYQSKGPARKATLLKQLITQKLKEGDDIREFLLKFFDTVDKLKDMEIEINKDLLTILLLYSLPKNFENFRCAIESRDTLPDPEVLKIKIIEESEARKNSDSQDMSNALIAKRNFKSGKYNQQFKEQKWDKKREETFKYKCHRCRKYGHKASECYTKLNKHTAGNADAISYSGIKNESNMVNGKENDTLWCLDSGCTAHLCKNEQRFENISTLENEVLNLANNDSTSIVAKGTVSLNTFVGENKKTIDLKNTLYVPDLRVNLMSVSKITNHNCQVIFKKNSASVIDENGNVTIFANRIGDLYYVKEETQNLCGMITSKSKMEEWHQRFGHVNMKSLLEMKNKRIVNGLNFKGEEISTCEICLRGKLTRKPFPKISERKTEILDIVHTDLCGPMRTESNGKSKYFFTFIDDSSRWCETRFIRNKNEVLKIFKEYKALVERQTGRKIKCLQSDNGTEYCNTEFDNYLRECGIKRRLTVPQSPQQNGVAERKNRTLLEMARCMLIQAKLPSSFWAEAIATATYIRNRCPSKTLNNRTPFEKWMGKIPDVRHMQIFGCKTFILNKRINKGKFEPRSKKGILVGYSEQSKAYRVWIPEERKIEITRDIKFLNDFESNEQYEEFAPEELIEENNEYVKENNDLEIELKINDRSPNILNDVENNEEILEFEKVGETENFEENQENPLCPLKIGKGRPKIIRNGKPGRPKKNYNTSNISTLERSILEENYALMGEICLKQAISSPESAEWKNAIAEEIKSLIKNDTWEIVDRPRNRNIVSSRLILRHKLKSDGTLERRKARLVARGFSQRPGIDFYETFAPVARLGSIRMLTALAAQNDMKIHQLDITTAYLNGIIEEEIYMEMPDMLEESLKLIMKNKKENSNIRSKAKCMLENLNENKVCRLRKSLYGLKQAGRQWNKRFDEKLRSMDLKRCTSDPCVYYAKQGEDMILVAIYVDDVIIISKNVVSISKFKMDLMKEFEIRDLGEIHYCLGIEFEKSDCGYKISQKAYIKDILKKFGMEECKSVSTPMEPGTKLVSSEENQNSKDIPYREIVGSLNYLAVATRPDIAHSVSVLSQFNSCYDESHWKAAKRILRYLKGSLDLGIIYKKNNKNLQGYVDADWANCIIDRRSYTGYVFVLSSGAISWESRKQRTVALSSTEAEYMGLTEAAKEAVFLRKFLNELGFEKLSEMTLFNDNQSALKLSENPIYHNRTKHIDVRHHFIREVVSSGEIKISHLSTGEMPADMLTKAIGKTKMNICQKILGMEEEKVK